MSTNTVKQTKQTENTTGIVELSDAELNQVAGGTFDTYIKMINIEGEARSSSYGGGRGAGKVSM